MAQGGLPDLAASLQHYLQLDRLPDLAVLTIGILVGLIAKNIYAVVKGVMGFAGNFIGRMALGWWQDIRRETPNIVDFTIGALAEIEGRSVLLVDALVGPRRLSDVYFNPRTVFGVRVQAFFIKPERPWIQFEPLPQRGFSAKMRAWRNRRRQRAGLAPVSERELLLLKYRRVYAPLENLIGQYLTNQWAAEMAVGEPCYIFRFIVVLLYEKSASRTIDRQFQAFMIWEEVLRRPRPDGMVVFQPEFAERGLTIQRLAAAYTASDTAPLEFGSVFVMVPTRYLEADYTTHWVPNQAGQLVPIHRPVAIDGRLPLDFRIIHRAAASSIPGLDPPADSRPVETASP